MLGYEYDDSHIHVYQCYASTRHYCSIPYYTEIWTAVKQYKQNRPCRIEGNKTYFSLIFYELCIFPLIMYHLILNYVCQNMEHSSKISTRITRPSV